VLINFQPQTIPIFFVIFCYMNRHLIIFLKPMDDQQIVLISISILICGDKFDIIGCPQLISLPLATTLGPLCLDL